MKTYWLIGLFIYGFLGILPTLAAAMTSDNYSLDQDTADIIPFQPHALPTQVISPQGTQSNLEPMKPTSFAFTVSQDILPFGALSATNPVLRDLFITITSKGNDYQVFAFENHALAANPVDMIPNTTCDNGSCTAITPAPWTNNLTYGFGYRLGSDPKDTYKQFIDASKNKHLTPLLHGKAGATQEKVTYKVNVSRTQKLTSYLNVVTYIATPDY